MTASSLLGDRSLFPELKAAAYLNHAAISPPCLPVSQAVLEAVKHYAVLGAGAFPKLEAGRQELKARLARLVGATPGEIGLVPNTSRGLSEIALCLPWRARQRVLLFVGEFPANITPWQQAAKLHDLELVYQPADDLRGPAGLERLERELKRGVRLVALSWVQFQTGLKAPLKEVGELCARYGAELAVDAIQGLGAMPLNVNDFGIHYLSCGGHKWLLGSEGAGFLFAQSACAKELRPYTAGWLSHEEPLRFLFEGSGHLRYDRPLKSDVSFVEGGTQNVLGYAALGASVPLLLELGPASIFRHVDAYLERLEAELQKRGFISLRAQDATLRSTILSVETPGRDSLAIQRGLASRGISCAVPDGKLRFAPHFSNHQDEIPIVLEALDETLLELHE